MRSTQPYFIALLTLVLLLACKKPIPKHKRIYAKGEIIKILHSNSGSVRFKFKDTTNTERVGYYIHKISKLRVGEKYWITYNKDDIEDVKVHFTAPIIEDTLKYASSKAFVSWNHLNDFFNSNDCKFNYSYKGKRYLRHQKLVDKKIKEGDTVSIFINKSRPDIAYIKGNSKITKQNKKRFANTGYNSLWFSGKK